MVVRATGQFSGTTYSRSSRAVPQTRAQRPGRLPHRRRRHDLRRAGARPPGLVGASSRTQIDDAVASLDLELTLDELAELERPYTPRYDFQGVSDDAEITRIRA